MTAFMRTGRQSIESEEIPHVTCEYI